MRARSLLGASLVAVSLAACGASGSTPGSSDAAAGAPDAGPPPATLEDAGADALGPPDAADGAVDKAAACASTFGSALTRGFGRLDGTVIAVVQPKDTQCAMPNSDHVVVQVRMAGDVYRMVVNVQSDRPGPDPRVSYRELPITLPPPVWAEGWHAGVTLDYVALGAKSGDFTPLGLAELSAKVADLVPLGGRVSVYADTSGGASAHKVHRNDGARDGAIVLDADGPRPRALLFRFAEQTF